MNIPRNARRADCPHCNERTLRLWPVDPDGGYDQECETCGFNGYCTICDVEIDNDLAESIEDARFCSDRCTHEHFAQQAAEDQISAWKESS